MSQESPTDGCGPEPCRSCLRHRDCLGAAVQDSGAQAGTRCITVLALQRGQVLHRIGDAANAVYIVQSGALKARRHSVRGDEEIVAFRLPGDTVGLDEIGHRHRASETVALCASRICRLPLATLQHEARASRAVTEHLFNDLGVEFKRLHDRLQRERQPATVRVATFLLGQLQRRRRLFGESLDAFTLPMTRIDLARFLGLATETVSRIFTRLQLDHVIACDGASVRVIDADALRRNAGEDGASPHIACAA